MNCVLVFAVVWQDAFFFTLRGPSVPSDRASVTNVMQPVWTSQRHGTCDAVTSHFEFVIYKRLCYLIVFFLKKI